MRSTRFTSAIVAAFATMALVATACGSDIVEADPAARLDVDPTAPVDEWVAGVNAAGWDFHRTLEGNAVSSPVSIGTAFSLARAGASGETGPTLDAIFGFPAEGTHDAANAASQGVASASVDPNTVEVANRLFPDDTFVPLQTFVDVAEQYYGATAQTIDTADGAQAADDINAWVDARTRGLIPRIVNAGVVQGTHLVLVNTVYLKADWAEPFLAELTTTGSFHLDESTTTDVEMMHDREALVRRFVRLEGADAVELTYAGGDLSMWIVVPHDIEGLAQVEAALDADTIVGFDARAETGTVHLTMPKWETELPPTDLFGWLCPQGLCAGATFDEIAPGLFISAAPHGAKIIVDEKGTEAAAATALAFDSSAPPPPDLTLVADRPFAWAITHPDTGSVLFVGRLVDPAT